METIWVAGGESAALGAGKRSQSTGEKSNGETKRQTKKRKKKTQPRPSTLSPKLPRPKNSHRHDGLRRGGRGGPLQVRRGDALEERSPPGGRGAFEQQKQEGGREGRCLFEEDHDDDGNGLSVASALRRGLSAELNLRSQERERARKTL
jgi:hypothetical protein